MLSPVSVVRRKCAVLLGSSSISGWAMDFRCRAKLNCKAIGSMKAQNRKRPAHSTANLVFAMFSLQIIIVLCVVTGCQHGANNRNLVDFHSSIRGENHHAYFHAMKTPNGKFVFAVASIDTTDVAVRQELYYDFDSQELMIEGARVAVPRRSTLVVRRKGKPDEVLELTSESPMNEAMELTKRKLFDLDSVETMD